MTKKKKKMKAPPQVTLGGDVGLLVWKKYIVPLLRKTDMSTRELAVLLGVSAMTISRWRTYL